MSRARSPLESRTGTSGMFGKLGAELPKMRMSIETLIGLQHRASDASMSLAEYVRMVLDCHVFGPDHVANLAAERVRQVVGKRG